MSTARDIMLATGSSMESKPGNMLGSMLSMMLAIIGIFFVFMSVAQKGGQNSSMFFAVGIVFFVLAFIFNIGAKSLIK